MPIQILRTSVVDHPPDDLLPGQLAVEMASNPPRLWVGVPVDIDPSGRRQVTGRSSGWTTGDIKLTYQDEADDGWTMCDDRMIGPVLSGANKQGPEFEALYTLLFDNLTDAFAPLILRHPQEIPISRASAISAASAWANQLRMTLPRMLGRTLVGAGQGQGLSIYRLAEFYGQESVAIGESHLAHHSHLYVPAYSYAEPAVYYTLGYGVHPADGGWITAAGGGAGHSNVQPTTWLNAMICL